MATKKQDPNSAAVPQRAVDKLRTAREQKKRWEEAERDAKREIMDALGGKGVGTVRGETVVTVTTTKQSRIDVTALRNELPDVAATYTVLTPVETLRIVQVKTTDDEEG